MSLSLFFFSLFVSTSFARPASVEISLARTSWKRPAPGITRRAPKTAQMVPGLSGTENPSEMIVLLMETPTGSGRLPNRGIWPRRAGSWRGEMLL